jgi:hypothetical protein
MLTATYRFGEIPLAFESADPGWFAMLETRYGAFRDVSDDGTSPFSIRYECTGDEELPADLPSPLAVRPETPVIAPTPRGMNARAKSSWARIDLISGRAEITGPRAMYPLDNVLRQLLPLLCRDGVVLHSAALIHRGRALLACGPSRAGKSTLASLAAEAAIADELAAVRPDGTRFRVVSLPFWRSRPGSGRLEAILFLRHGREHHLRPLDTGSAFRRLASQSSWPVDFPPEVDRVLGVVTELVNTIQAVEFSFTPQRDAWDFLKRELL